MAFWGARKREAQREQDAVLQQRAERAIVEADERIRLTRDELDFATAELGPRATENLRVALDAVTTHMREAFTLHQLNHDEIPDTDEELRTRNARIVQLCEWAEKLIDERTSALAEDVARARRAPEILAKVNEDAARLRERLPRAQEIIGRLQERYADSAVRQIARSGDEAAQLLAFAEHSSAVSAARREQGKRDDAMTALETATEAVRRAATLLDAVEEFEISAMRAESMLTEAVLDARSRLLAARALPARPALTEAAAGLDAALAEMSPPGAKADPFLDLARVREAGTRLDAAMAAVRDRLANPAPPREHVEHQLRTAEQQIQVARSLISGHRGYIGADARTRLAEAERLRDDATMFDLREEDDRERALPLVQRAGSLASEAVALAQRDIDGHGPGWGGQGGRQQNGWGDAATGILGGIILGGILGDIFD